MTEQSIAEMAAFHKTHKTFSGSLAIPHREFICSEAARLDSRSGLDYGCGKGVQYAYPMDRDGSPSFESCLGFEMFKFDPCVARYAARPPAGSRFDIVMVTSVLYWVPLAELSATLAEIFGYADQVVYISEKIGPAKKRGVVDESVGYPRDWTPDDWTTIVRPFAMARPDLAVWLAFSRPLADELAPLEFQRVRL